MEKSTVVQVDESTKGIMQEVENGISSAIDEKMADMADDILDKLKSLDSLSMTADELRRLAKDTKALNNAIPPMTLSLDKIERKADDTNDAMTSQSEELKDIQERLDKIEASMEKLMLTQEMIINLVTPFWKKWGKKKEE